MSEGMQKRLEEAERCAEMLRVDRSRNERKLATLSAAIKAKKEELEKAARSEQDSEAYAAKLQAQAAEASE